MSMDLFETRTMLRMLEQIYPPRTFLLETFFKTVETSTSEHVDIDIMKGKRRLAPFVSPLQQGKVVERIGWSTLTFKPPYVKPKMKTEAGEFLKRLPGQIIYQGDDSPSARAAKALAMDLAELQDQITRREEWMAAQALTTGQIDIVGEGVDSTIDFLMDAGHIIDKKTTETDRWSNENSSPIKQLNDAVRLIAKDSGLTANVAVLGSDAADAFIEHPLVQKMLDNRRIELGQIIPDQLPDGVMYLGQLRRPRIDIYTYDEYFNADGTGTVTPMVPPKKVILGSTKARTARHYGAIRDLKLAGSAAVRWFPKTWEEEDPSIRWLMVQSAPLVCLHQPDAFAVMEVLA